MQANALNSIHKSNDGRQNEKSFFNINVSMYVYK